MEVAAGVRWLLNAADGVLAAMQPPPQPLWGRMFVRGVGWIPRATRSNRPRMRRPRSRLRLWCAVGACHVLLGGTMVCVHVR